MKKIFLAIILFFLFQTTYAETQKIRVLLDWFLNPSHAPLFIAKEKGFFKAENLEVELIGPADPADPPKLVAAGKADIALTYQPQFIEQVENGLPLLAIGTLIDSPLNCLVVLKDSGIHTLADLKGKKIGFSSGGVTSVSLNTMLKSVGLSLKDVEHINVHYNLTQAMLSHKVDAVTGMMRTFEVIQMELAGYPARIFYPEQHGIPTYSELIFVVNKNNVSNLQFKHFLTALKKATAYTKAHPKETWLLFAKSHPELNDELNHRAWASTVPLFADDPAAINKKNWLRFISFMQQNGLIKSTKGLNEYTK